MVLKPYTPAPKLTRPTSPSLTVVPSLLARRMMFSNCSGVVNRPSVATVTLMPWPFSAGSEPSEPAANCTFCAVTAASAWLAERP